MLRVSCMLPGASVPGAQAGGRVVPAVGITLDVTPARLGQMRWVDGVGGGWREAGGRWTCGSLLSVREHH